MARSKSKNVRTVRSYIPVAKGNWVQVWMLEKGDYVVQRADEFQSRRLGMKILFAGGKIQCSKGRVISKDQRKGMDRPQLLRPEDWVFKVPFKDMAVHPAMYNYPPSGAFSTS
ncbi:hypothetical protein HYW55_01305 [Candidatus Gottesmanbacteria bacterium]|nr:hypothetical protein [Candidatus Gottesmanbacteria bacterium]